jgi:serine/threonine protein phosphatase PrpC
MKMYFDKFSEIGSTHKENEDFAVIGDEKNQFVIVSDGCSGSKNTAMGSRLLSLYMGKMLKDYGGNFLSDLVGLGNNAIILTNEIRKKIGLERECLDATLLIAYVNEKDIVLAAWGDGNIIIKRNNCIELISINYTEEIPYYLSYRLYLDRKLQFEEIAKERNLKMKINEGTKDSYYSPFHVYQKNIDRNGLDYIILSTDGMLSFIDNKNNHINQNDINRDITAFKRLNGEFIARRMNRMMKDNAKEGIIHYDDFTVAGISFIEKGQEEE